MVPTERGTRAWTRLAPDYDTWLALVERWFLAAGRRWLVWRASGDVLEVGIGTGANLSYYARGAVRLTGLDPSPGMLDAARTKADGLGLDVTLVEGDAMALPFPDASFDTVVSTLVLCGVPEVRGALAEMVRVLRPGGQLLLADHVVSTNPVVRAGQRVLEAVTKRVWGEYWTRRPRLVVEELGLEVVATRRRTFGVLEDVHART